MQVEISVCSITGAALLTWLTADSVEIAWDMSSLWVILRYGMLRGAAAGGGPLLDVLFRNLSLKEGAD